MACKIYLFLFLFCLVSLQSCSSGGVTLVHPQSGSTMRCGAAGMGTRQGYVPVEKLTPDQRADLERRGVLPK
ncbi:MAG: hypothetical protein ACE5JO_01045 [Candidatus Binatia bacterium]